MAKKKPKNSIRYPSQERSRATVDVILEATAQIIEKQGNTTFSTNLIASKAGVSIGGLYQYFENREAILNELRLRERREDLKVLTSALEENEGKSIEVIIRAILKVSLARFADHPVLRRTLDTEVVGSKSSGKMKQLRKQLASLLAGKLEKIAGKKIPADFEKRLEVLIAGFEGSYYAAIDIYGNELVAEDFIDDSTEMIFAFLRKTKVLAK